MPPTPQSYKGKKVVPLPYDENHKPIPALFLPIINGSGNITGYLPAKATDAGDGTAVLEVGATVTVTPGDFQIGAVEIKDGNSDARADVEFDGTHNALTIRANSLPLPTGAATELTLGSVLTELATLNATDFATETTLAAVLLALDTVEAKLQSIIDNTEESNASAVTSVARSAASVTLLAANTSRKGSTIYNDATGPNSTLFVKLGAVASLASYTVQVGSQSYYEVPFKYTGNIDGIWAGAGAGNARITELT